MNISSVHERGEQGKPDEVHLATARREHRFLLTKDNDFLDDKRFPLQRKGPGIIYIHGDFREERQYAAAVANLLNYIVSYSQNLRGSKDPALRKAHVFPLHKFRGQDLYGRMCHSA